MIAYVAAGLALRRILYNETWSLAFYLSFVIRFFMRVEPISQGTSTSLIRIYALN